MKKRKHFFNLVEISLALAVVGIGVTGIMALFVPAIDATRDSVADNFASNIADTFLAFVENLKKNDWNGNSFTKAPDAEFAKPAIKDPSLWGTHDNGLPPDVYSMKAVDNSVNGTLYGIKTADNSFAAHLRVWEETPADIYKIGDGAPAPVKAKMEDCYTPAIAGERAVFTRIHVELSWPAQVEFSQRKKRLYVLEIFNRNYVTAP